MWPWVCYCSSVGLQVLKRNVKRIDQMTSKFPSKPRSWAPAHCCYYLHSSETKGMPMPCGSIKLSSEVQEHSGAIYLELPRCSRLSLPSHPPSLYMQETAAPYPALMPRLADICSLRVINKSFKAKWPFPTCSLKNMAVFAEIMQMS